MGPQKDDAMRHVPRVGTEPLSVDPSRVGSYIHGWLLYASSIDEGLPNRTGDSLLNPR